MIMYTGEFSMNLNGNFMTHMNGIVIQTTKAKKVKSTSK